jgi:pyruvate dehydrogenase E2 component (dihydrolipoamide acetyltransferase)
MAVTITLPKLGMTMESARISAWLRGDGQPVEQDDPVLAIETDKATAEVVAPARGILWQYAQPGEELPVGAALGAVAEDRAEYGALRAGGTGTVEPAKAAPAGPAQDAGGSPGTGAPGGQKIRIAPVARAMAAERGIDITLLTGTGTDGRVTKEDVLNFERQQQAAVPAAAPPSPAAQPPAAAGDDPTRRIPRTERRRIVAAKMMQAVRDAAQATHSATVDATALDTLRREILARTESAAGVRITITDLVMKLTALAIRHHPIMNSSYTDEADIVHERIHMGMAMSQGEGDLLVPVIRDIETKSLADIARMRIDYVDRARRGKLMPDELTGSTFTFSGLGMFGLERFVAMINRPENAILAAGAILERPWVYNGQLAIRKVMTVTLTYDHRTIYGADAARFMATLVSNLEDPQRVLAGEDVGTAGASLP